MSDYIIDAGRVRPVQAQRVHDPLDALDEAIGTHVPVVAEEIDPLQRVQVAAAADVERRDFAVAEADG